MPAQPPSTAPCLCHCGRPLSYADCCGVYHTGSAAAPDAGALMRSRYSAYVLGNADYLRATWQATKRPAVSERLCDAATRWLGLEIKREAATGADSALVEFVARYKVGGRAHRLHEVSRFVREDGCWYYVDGQFVDAKPRRTR